MSDELDDALATLGITTSVTREDELYLLLTEGKSPKISNCRYWMIGEMGRYKQMLELGIKITKDKMFEGVLQSVMLSKTEYAKVAIMYYLQCYHLPYFMDINDKPAGNIHKMVDMLVQHPGIKEIIEKYG